MDCLLPHRRREQNWRKFARPGLPKPIGRRYAAMKYAGIARIAGLILVTILSIVEDVEATRSFYDATRYEKIIVPQVAGQLLRQPSAEEKWQELLLSLPALQDQNLDSEVARRSVLDAQGQVPLVEEYTRDIWSKVTRLRNLDACGSASSSDTNVEDGLYSKHLYIFVSESFRRL